MRKAFWCSLAVAIVLPFADTRAQTGAAMLMQPLVNDEELLEFRGDSIFLNPAHTDHPGAPKVRLGIYETSGRIREQRERWLPRMGIDVLYLNLRNAGPVLPPRLVD